MNKLPLDKRVQILSMLKETPTTREMARMEDPSQSSPLRAHFLLYDAKQTKGPEKFKKRTV